MRKLMVPGKPAYRIGHGEGHQEGRDVWPNQNHRDPGADVCPEAEAPEPLQAAPGAERGGTAGTGHPGRGVHTDRSEIGVADHVPAVLY